MEPFPFSHVTIDDAFWAPWFARLSTVTLPAQFDQIAVHTGRLANFQRVAAGESGGHQGRYYDDSDVYKWCEACAYALAHHRSEPLIQQLNTVIQAIASAQDEEGYLVTFFQLMHPDLKFRNLSYMHEMYCMGHLMEAGVALADCLNDTRLLTCSVKAADLLVSKFGEAGTTGYCGHSEVELALIRLGKHVGNPEYANLARRMMTLRGQKPTLFERELQDDEAMKLSPWAKQYLNLRGEYFQDHAPMVEHTEIVGHAVRGMYLYTAAVSMVDDPAWETMQRTLWRNLVDKRLYVTGGTGSSSKNEGFTRDYDLPNLDSYAETCAAVALIGWGRELAQHFGESDFMDVAELALFNAALAGISTSGDQYFYANPLESRMNHGRVPWFDCACCPPNIARLIGGVHRLAISHSPDANQVWIHFPIQGTYTLPNGQAIRIESGYPASGRFKVTFTGTSATELDLRVRIPGWVDEMGAEIDNVDFEADFEQGYAVFNRTWQPGESLAVDWEMEPRWLESHPLVFDNLGCSALAIGPLIYCLESQDTLKPAQLFMAMTDEPVEVEVGTKPGDWPSAKVSGLRLSPSDQALLYDVSPTTEFEEEEATFIPYALWSNQGPSTMRVWVRSTIGMED